jgi:hypothetical protein
VCCVSWPGSLTYSLVYALNSWRLQLGKLMLALCASTAALSIATSAVDCTNLLFPVMFIHSHLCCIQSAHTAMQQLCSITSRNVANAGLPAFCVSYPYQQLLAYLRQCTIFLLTLLDLQYARPHETKLRRPIVSMTCITRGRCFSVYIQALSQPTLSKDLLTRASVSSAQL